jgi:hypothetical protein
LSGLRWKARTKLNWKNPIQSTHSVSITQVRENPRYLPGFREDIRFLNELTRPPVFSELVVPVFPTASMVAMGLPSTGKYGKVERSVGDWRG